MTAATGDTQVIPRVSLAPVTLVIPVGATPLVTQVIRAPPVTPVSPTLKAKESPEAEVPTRAPRGAVTTNKVG
jgi:hypothetical protein